MRRTVFPALVVAVAAFVGVFAASALTDESVVVNGRTIYCAPSKFDEPPPEIDDRCDAQGDDRRRQALLAGVGAGLLAALTTVVVLRRSERA